MRQFRTTFLSHSQWVLWVLVALLPPGLLTPASALEPQANEGAKIKACERDICGMILSRTPKGGDLSCALSKTWHQEALEAGKSAGFSWTFGDARCSTNIVLKRADIVGALTQPKYEISLPAQPVTCVIERDGVSSRVELSLAPKLTFKAGAADKIWINLQAAEGPKEVKRLISSVAKLEDTLGLFHKPMIKAVNKFIGEQCPARYGTKVAEKKPAADAAPQAAPATEKAAAP